MKPKVLFFCTGNSARSQMAEGYLRYVAGDRFEAASAGIEPKGLNPPAVEVMRENGIDWTAVAQIGEQIGVSRDMLNTLGLYVQRAVRTPFPRWWRN